jgi:nitrite reductase (NADH) small subunit
VTWEQVCDVTALTPGRGVCARLAGRDVAVFLLTDGQVFALDDLDPWSGASVLSRGLVGSRGEVDVVFSPMYKQALCLRTGQALDEPDVRVATFAARVVDGMVEVAA